MKQKEPEFILNIYFKTAAVFLILAVGYGIAFSDILPGPILQGPFISWAHFFTLGVFFPLFGGMALYRRIIHSGAKISLTLWYTHYSLYILTLPAYLYFIFFREGSWLLTIVATGLTLNFLIYIYIYAILLRKTPKQQRDSFFWIDAASLFFFFQTVTFGMALVTNLQFGWFFSGVENSVKVHAHSGILGYFFPVLALLLEKESDSPKSLRLGAWAFFIFMFLWTSVHDKNRFVFLIVGAGLALSSATLAAYILFSIRNIRGLRPAMFFVFISVLIGADIATSGNLDYIWEKNIHAQYGISVFFGFLLPSGLAVAGKLRNHKEKEWIYWMGSVFTGLLMLGFYFSKTILVAGSLVALLGLYGFIALCLAGFLPAKFSRFQFD